MIMFADVRCSTKNFKKLRGFIVQEEELPLNEETLCAFILDTDTNLGGILE